MGLSKSKAAPAKNLAAQVDEHDRRLLDIMAQRDQLQMYLRRMQVKVSQDTDLARTLVSQDRKAQAMLALRRKRYHEQLANDCETQLDRLLELIETVEMAQVQKTTVEALAAGAATLKKLQLQIGGVEYVEQLMEDHAEAMLAQQELSAALAQVGVSGEDAEAAEELEKLLEAQAEKEARAALAAAPVPPPGAAAEAARAEAPAPRTASELREDPAATSPAGGAPDAPATQRRVATAA